MLQVITGGFGCLLCLIGVVLLAGDIFLNSHTTLLNETVLEAFALLGIGLVLINQAVRSK